MESYIEQVERLRTWTAEEVKTQPHLAVGQLCSAAASIEKLGAMVEKLNRENFWLTQMQAAEEARTIKLPPLEVGSTAWAIGNRGGWLYAKPGKVTRVEILNRTVVLHVNGVGKGQFGERVFATREDAMKVLERMREEAKT